MSNSTDVDKQENVVYIISAVNKQTRDPFSSLYLYGRMKEIQFKSLIKESSK